MLLNMRKRLSLLSTTAAVVVCVSLTLAPGRAQAPAAPVKSIAKTTAKTVGKGARMPDGKPNLNGVWQYIGSANWDIQDHSPAPGPFWQLGAIGAIPAGQGVVEGNEIPYKPAALEKKKQNKANWPAED